MAQAQAPTQAKEPIAEIVHLFDQYRIVMLGEIHGSIQLDDLLKKLVNTPAFIERVNDIVVEAGNSRYQDVLDRYIYGGDVAIDKLQPVWQDVVGAPSGIPTPPYHGLFAAIREVNRRLPPDRKIRVLAGDPPIAWERVQSRDDIAPFLAFRDEHYASVVRYEVLAKRRKALLVMGGGHFRRRDGKPTVIERQMIDAFAKPYVIIVGSDVVNDDVDPRFAAVNGPNTPWIMEMKGTWLGGLPQWPDSPQPETWEQTADAYLFLGTRDTLTTGGEAFDLEGTPYGNELRRRWKIFFPNPPTALPKSDGSTIPLLQRTAPGAPEVP